MLSRMIWVLGCFFTTEFVWKDLCGNPFKKMGHSRPLFCLFSSFSCYNFNTNWKKHRWWALDSNLGLQDGRRRENHGAMAGLYLLMLLCLFPHFLLSCLLQTFYSVRLSYLERAHTYLLCNVYIHSPLFFPENNNHSSCSNLWPIL